MTAMSSIRAAAGAILLISAAAAADARWPADVAASGPVPVERLGSCDRRVCPAVVVLSGSKGFGAPGYREIERTLRAAGLDAYLVHVLSEADLDIIARAPGAKARIAFYARRMPDWVDAVRRVVADLASGPRRSGTVGVLGISLGAEIAAAAVGGRTDVGALVLVDGGLPRGDAQPIRKLPPLLLIWGGADRTFPPAVGRDLQRTVRDSGGSADLKVYDGGAHDFFLRAGDPTAGRALRDAAAFLTAHLSPEP